MTRIPKKIDGKPSYRTAEEMAWFRPEDERDNAAVAPKSVVIGHSRFNWAKDCRPEILWGKTIIYEAHVKGFTKQFPDLKYAGTYKALSDKRVLAYLQKLGVTTVELLPIHHHLDEYHLQQMGLSNYWGYNTYSHFAVEPSYADNPERAAAEFKQAVKALHQAGLEVILDVVYNHTAEQDDKGPMLCQRGIDNTLWYWHTSYGSYENWSGCGNTLNIVRRDVTRWATDSLRYWAEEFHVDGFRFGLGKVAIWAHLPNVWPGRPIFSTTAAAILPPASISSPRMTALRCAIWSATTKNTTKPMAKTTAMGIMKTSATTTA